MISNIKSIIKSSNIFVQFRYSDWYLNYWKKKNPSVKETLEKERSYYLSLISNIHSPDSPLIFDIGAHEGYITQFLLEHGFKVVALEPDKRNQKILTRRFKSNNNFTLIKKGASSSNHSASFFVHKSNSAFNTISSKWKGSVEKKSNTSIFQPKQEIIELVTLDSLIQDIGKPKFIKVDVEGHELEVVRGLSHPIPLITFEANFPEFKNETIETINILTKLDSNYLFNYSKNFQVELSNYIVGGKLIDQLKDIKTTCCLEIICQLRQ